ncbi:hypothetical protein ACIBKX_10780 [Streptomyces sp. NPDC050658]|uniref:hypothetical protein n=1 Tax=unclassified Streptomyces TaxID=2593676 RepID=UPI003419A055
MNVTLKRAGVVAGTALAAGALTVTSAAAAGPPMPDFRGKNLVRVFSGLDYRTRVDVSDTSGFHRHVLWPPNWKVCTQSPVPGRELTGQTVTIGVVKRDETCPRA